MQKRLTEFGNLSQQVNEQPVKMDTLDYQMMMVEAEEKSNPKGLTEDAEAKRNN